jgi:hypothetical protein
MRGELKEKLLATAPMLYKYFKDNPKNVIDCQDDLFGLSLNFQLRSRISISVSRADGCVL